MFAVGVNEAHPANKKVKAWVHLRDLQREHGLTGAHPLAPRLPVWCPGGCRLGTWRAWMA